MSTDDGQSCRVGQSACRVSDSLVSAWLRPKQSAGRHTDWNGMSWHAGGAIAVTNRCAVFETGTAGSSDALMLSFPAASPVARPVPERCATTVFALFQR